MKTLVATTLALAISTPALAQKTGRYSPEIERAYVARLVWAAVDKKCTSDLKYNFDTGRKLEQQAGFGDDERPNMEVRERAFNAFTKRMAEAAVRKNVNVNHIDANTACLVLLYTFGPNGTWIKGLVEEKP